jgi:hypothetical protein
VVWPSGRRAYCAVVWRNEWSSRGCLLIAHGSRPSTHRAACFFRRRVACVGVSAAAAPSGTHASTVCKLGERRVGRCKLGSCKLDHTPPPPARIYLYTQERPRYYRYFRVQQSNRSPSYAAQRCTAVPPFFSWPSTAGLRTHTQGSWWLGRVLAWRLVRVAALNTEYLYTTLRCRRRVCSQ